MVKTYFEILEEEFGSLTRDVQRGLAEEERQRQLKAERRSSSLSQQAPINNDILLMMDDYDDNDDGEMETIGVGTTENDNDITSDQSCCAPEQQKLLVPKEILPLSKLFERCHVIYQRMEAQARYNDEYKQRLLLYQVQLEALCTYHNETKAYHDDNNKTGATKTKQTQKQKQKMWRPQQGTGGDDDSTIEITFRFADDAHEWILD